MNLRSLKQSHLKIFSIKDPKYKFDEMYRSLLKYWCGSWLLVATNCNTKFHNGRLIRNADDAIRKKDGTIYTSNFYDHHSSIIIEIRRRPSDPSTQRERLGEELLLVVKNYV